MILQWTSSRSSAQKRDSGSRENPVSAIPAYNGLEDTWVQSFADQGYEVNVGNLIEQFDYSVKYVNNASRRVWEPE